MPRKRKVTHRIAYDVWTNSQLSIVRHYGACTLNGKRYEFDPEQMKVPNEHGKYKPDLITYDK
jgi:hypothetical protein